VCTIDDYRSGGKLHLRTAKSRVRFGINTRISRFLKHFGSKKGKRPPIRVTATSTVCAANATEVLKVDEPGIEYQAPSWRALAPEFENFHWDSGGTTTSAAVDAHAADSDPVARDRQANKCYTTSTKPAGAGVVQVTSPALTEPMTMMGLPIVKLDYSTVATDYWIEGRLFDEAPNGSLTLVTRGPCRVNTTAAPDVDCKTFSLFGNGWLFETGHKLVLELTQADTPFLRKDNFPSTIDITKIDLEIPEADPELRNDFRDAP
jgi:predicted acyl esterase